MLLGEVNLPPKQLRAFFGATSDELQMLFDFPVMQAMYLALAREDARPLRRHSTDGHRSPRTRSGRCSSAITTSSRSTSCRKRERAEVFAAFGPDEEMQLYGRGLRRRLPAMLDGDPDRVRLVYSLLFSLPGTPVLFYGEEIGMGENLEIPGRLSVRTPMQWTDERNGGFSPAAPSKLPRPLPDGDFGPMGVNVADQRRDPNSTLNWFERLIRRRRETPEFGWGSADAARHGRRPGDHRASLRLGRRLRRRDPQPERRTAARRPSNSRTSRMSTASSTCSTVRRRRDR